MSALVKRQPVEGSKETSGIVDRLRNRLELSSIDSKRQLLLGLLLPNIRNPLRAPRPAIVRIVLDNSKKTWHCGDEISGHIRLIVNEPIVVEHITLTLEGVASARVHYHTMDRDLAPYGSDIKLFSRLTEINANPEKTSSSILAPKGYEYPFTMALPEDCPESMICAFPEATQLFDNSSSQLLPSSFSDRRPQAPTTRDRCNIKYTICATLIPKQLSTFSSPTSSSSTILNLIQNKKTPSLTIPLNLRPFPDFVPPNLPLAHKRSTLTVYPVIPVLTLPRVLPISIRKIKSALRSSSIPKVLFHVSTFLPRYGIIGQPLKIELSISNIDSPVKDGPTQIALTDLAISLVSETIIRTLPMQKSLDVKIRGADETH
ncbi:hypothetical protein MMC14_007899 [Varicellaria rhodocarpa]|nr:hypothetical protein [Varicellaria rhodocarpa]